MEDNSVYDNHCLIYGNVPITLRDGMMGTWIQFLSTTLLSFGMLIHISNIMINEPQMLLTMLSIIFFLSGISSMSIIILSVAIIEHTRDITYSDIIDRFNLVGLISVLLLASGLIIYIIWSIVNFTI